MLVKDQSAPAPRGHISDTRNNRLPLEMLKQDSVHLADGAPPTAARKYESWRRTRFGSSPDRRRVSAASGRKRRLRAATGSRRRRVTSARSPILSRNTATASPAIKLDVTDKAAVDAAVAEAHSRFGRLDVVINNAGYGHFGAIEEVSEEEARAQIETNVFGALWVTQAALPIMRAQGSGHIIQISSIGGVNAFPNLGLYHASKWALEGFSQALGLEVAEFGIHVTLVEPGRILHRLGRAVGQGRQADRGLPGGARQDDGAPRATWCRAIRPRRARRCWRSSTPPSRRSGVLRRCGLPMITPGIRQPHRAWEKWDHVADMAQGAKKNRKG